MMTNRELGMLVLAIVLAKLIRVRKRIGQLRER